MPALMKFFAGLAAVLSAAWLNHGPLGGGEKLIEQIQGQAEAAVAAQAVPGVEVRLSRDPLSREAILSGPADRFQREGQGSLKGLNEIVGEIEGVSGVRWANPPPSTSAAGGAR